MDSKLASIKQFSARLSVKSEERNAESTRVADKSALKFKFNSKINDPTVNLSLREDFDRILFGCRFCESC